MDAVLQEGSDIRDPVPGVREGAEVLWVNVMNGCNTSEVVKTTTTISSGHWSRLGSSLINNSWTRITH